MSYGDVDAAFANAPHVFEDEMFLHRGGAMTLEGRAVLASYDAGADLLTVWSATQTPHLCRGTLADLLERDLESIRVIAPSSAAASAPRRRSMPRRRSFRPRR